MGPVAGAAAAAVDAATGGRGGEAGAEEVEGGAVSAVTPGRGGDNAAVEEAARKKRRVERAAAMPGRDDDLPGGAGGAQATAAAADAGQRGAAAAAGSRGPPAAGRSGEGAARRASSEGEADRRVRRRTAPAGSATQGTSGGRMPWEGQPRWMRIARGLGGVSSEDEHDVYEEAAGVGAEQLATCTDDVQSGRLTLRVTGPLVWCSACAGYALRRWGVRLRGACRPRRGDATRRRLELLHQGRHPITGVAIL